VCNDVALPPVKVPSVAPVQEVTTTTTTTTNSVAEMENIPIKFSLMGLPAVINDVSMFKDYMFEEFKAIVMDVARILIWRLPICKKCMI
jgi:hypothetical protein